MTAQGSTATNFDVVFVGRVNIDLTVQVPYRASPGGTTFGSALVVTPGGKSLNQAIAASRHGGRCRLIANAGADAWGHQITRALAAAGVDTRYVNLVDGATTGAAIIEVTPDGESAITLAVSPATELTSQDVRTALDATAADTVVVQLDLPPEPVTTLLTGPHHALTIGNLIPHAGLDPALLTHLDVLVVNEHEAATIVGSAVGDPLDAATALRHLGPGITVVTAGARGAAYTSPDASGILPAPAVPVIDTTGAGDAFLGALAIALAAHIPLPEAVRTAVHSGAQTVQHVGAQPQRR